MGSVLKTLNLSTGHLTAKTARLITQEATRQVAGIRPPTNVGMWVAIYDTGYILPTDYVEDLPKDLNDVFEYARFHGCELVRFDSIAPVLNELPTYEWDFNLEVPE